MHYQAYFIALFNDNKRFGDAAGNKHGFESAANVEEKEKNSEDDTTKLTEELCDNLREVAIAATADKEHLQQMTSTNEDLLKVVKEQQQQISALIKQNGELTTALSKKGGNEGNNNRGNESNTNKRNSGNNENGNRGNDSNNGREKRSYGCAICGKHRTTSECLELKKNKHKRKEGWTSIFA